MQTLATLVLIFSASIVMWFDLREVFVAYYSEVIPHLSMKDKGIFAGRIGLCLAVVLVMCGSLFGKR